jgi:hypothetical protein
MTKIFVKDGNRIVVADDAKLADWPGYVEEAITKNSDVLNLEAIEKRDALLLASDADWAKCTSMLWSGGSYTAWKSNTHCQAWATYRQALRDVPSQAGFPKTIVWPTKPGEIS